jgi:hypothetical protein
MSGNWVIGNEVKANKPKSVINIDITVESMGLLIKSSNMWQ